VLAVVPLMLDGVRILDHASRTDNLAYAQALDLAKCGTDVQTQVIDATKAPPEIVARAYIALAATRQDCTGVLISLDMDPYRLA
jgi:hypothetical protein